jgi:hypothetical protein
VLVLKRKVVGRIILVYDGSIINSSSHDVQLKFTSVAHHKRKLTHEV